MQWLAALALMVNLWFSTIPSFQFATVEIHDLGISHQFGQQITFKIQVTPVENIREILVYITPEGKPTVWQEISLDQANDEGVITHLVDARQISLAPFSKVGYRYEATLTNGEKVTSETRAFFYDDNRFNWQTFESDGFEVHWYGEDSTTGQEIVNIAQDGLKKAQSILKADPPDPLRIYLYNSSNDLQSALQLTQQNWVAGHAAPEMGMVLVSLSSGPEWKLELERQIPHEMMHLLQYQIMKDGYDLQPTWLIEGMASITELYPNPEYQRVLASTVQSNELIPLNTLCASFPREAAPAFQAYAQSESFTRYLYEKYGASGLLNLIIQYQNGLSCEDGFAAAYGASLDQVEYRWRQETLGVNASGLVLTNLSPYLGISLIIFIPAVMAFLPLRRKTTRSQKDGSHE